MIVGDLSRRELGECLAGDGLALQFGPFNLRIRSNLDSFASLVHRLYEPYPLPDPAAISDFHVQISAPRGLRRWVRRQACFGMMVNSFCAASVNTPPALEWGIGWCGRARII
jgi:hypothetical protein